jgi:hypothetical protein
LTEWLATGGSLGVREPQSAQPLLRRKGVKQGAKLMFFSGVVFPLMFALSILVDNPAPLLVSFVIFFAGLAMMLYSRLFGEEMFPSKKSQAQTAPLDIAGGPTAFLPSAQVPLNPIGRQKMRTAEMVRPPSVTEHTTKLLDED